MKTVIVIPAFNEETHIGDVIAACRREGYEHIVVVDDGSTDRTAALAGKAGAAVVSHLINRGAGAATQTGLAVARLLGADAAVTIDGDGQHAARDIKNLLEALKETGADIIIGSRFLQKGNDIPFGRKVFNNFANIVTLLLAGHYFSDSQSGMKAFSRKALSMLEITANGYEFSSEIFREARHHRLKVKEVPISVLYSPYSLSKGQHFATGMTTILKLMIRSIMR